MAKKKRGNYSNYAIATLVLGIISLFFGWFPIFGWIFIGLTILFGVIALKKLKETKRLKGKNLAIAGIIMAIIGMFFAYYLFTTTLQSQEVYCNDIPCFVEQANKCKEATLELSLDTGKYSFNSNDCVFYKTLIELNPSESDEMKSLLEGTNLFCHFNRGEFNKEWITSTINGIEDCEGNLKDITEQLLVFT